ncbi:hypothetical protein [Candidatus Mycoplasma haematominutum]|uniref:Uncharacterized protein n=1 Tax=Candidatus Mycoplasma haematominutum 'Birmingham 1' TaxID=1116213 RepID=G8C3U4_9MOLU|nr:hypothetical protein [Candidatus Mycoplasma haematominutum]CCE66992.1 hypothetical protein MHM_04740 [Candidatus Mycoplasma haematominutum 'Birmingham 1']
MFAVRTLLGCTGLTGGICAVSVPLALSAGNSYTVIKQVTLDKCRVPAGLPNSQINYGTDVEGSVCWTTVASDGFTDNNISDSYTDLFREKWANISDSIRELRYDEKGSSEWTDQCIGEGVANSWVLFSETTSVKYLGRCGTTLAESTEFVKLKTEAGGVKWWICGANCWASGETSENTKIFKTENSNNWKEVAFYKSIKS